MMADIMVVLIILLLPRAIVLLSNNFRFLGTLGPVFLCYAAGFCLSFALNDSSMATTLSEVCVPIAIPLILLSADLSSLKRLARPAITSFVLMIIAVGTACTLGVLIFGGSVDNAHNISGMLMGLYTGGTPNLMAIGLALGVEQDVILLANTADLIAGGIYFMLLISVIPRLFRSFLPAFRATAEKDNALEEKLQESYNGETMLFSFKALWKRAPAFFLALLSVGVSLGTAYLITGNATNIMVVMLGVTTCGVLLSFIKKVRELPGSYDAGQYFIYMFSVAIGMSFDLSMIQSSTVMLLLMLLFVQFCAVALHALLARIFKIDADTTIITSTAGIYGPAFIPSVAGALKNKEVVLTGLVCGIFGYAVGNYLGIGMAYLLSLI